jgi:ferredoxin
MKIVVDFDRCQSNAACMSEAPEVFQVDDKGFLNILQENPPEGLRKQVQAAARYCPTGAIKIEE